MNIFVKLEVMHMAEILPIVIVIVLGIWVLSRDN